MRHFPATEQTLFSTLPPMTRAELGPIFAQDGFSARFEWGPSGVQALAAGAEVLVIVDVLSFTTAVEVAVTGGALIYPYRHRDDSAATFARSIAATLALARQHVSIEAPYSVSPASLTSIPVGTRLVLPSPNGSAISVLAAELGRPILAGCLRHAAAAAQPAGTRSGSSPRANDGATAACARPTRISSAPERSSTGCPSAGGRPKRKWLSARSTLSATGCRTAS